MMEEKSSRVLPAWELSEKKCLKSWKSRNKTQHTFVNATWRFRLGVQLTLATVWIIFAFLWLCEREKKKCSFEHTIYVHWSSQLQFQQARVIHDEAHKRMWDNKEIIAGHERNRNGIESRGNFQFLRNGHRTIKKCVRKSRRRSRKVRQRSPFTYELRLISFFFLPNKFAIIVKSDRETHRYAQKLVCTN